MSQLISRLSVQSIMGATLTLRSKSFIAIGYQPTRLQLFSIHSAEFKRRWGTPTSFHALTHRSSIAAGVLGIATARDGLLVEADNLLNSVQVES